MTGARASSARRAEGPILRDCGRLLRLLPLLLLLGAGCPGDEQPSEADTKPVAPGALAHLVFEQGPFNVSARTPMAPTVRVAALDAAGNLVDEPDATVTLELDAPADATLLGGSAPLVDGVATFPDLEVDRAGDYMLIAKIGDLASEPSHEFAVRPRGATQIVIAESPDAARAGENFVGRWSCVTIRATARTAISR